MRILQVHFKNINSLEGESHINFEQAPFAGAGVFAITGANGSGKSSILDAITLALYGETFRFHRPAEHVMTKQSTDSFATVEFSLAQDKYRSSWRVQRTGKQFQPVEMQLINALTGDVLAENAQQVCARIAEITGMNFRNFTRSMLLAQGDFAAFLNALDNERLDILEKIISTDIYSDYKQQITEKAEQAQQQLTRLERQLSNISLLSPAQREAHELDLADFTAQYDELSEKQQQLKQQQAAVKNSGMLQAQLAKQQKSLQLAENLAKVTQEKLNNLASQQHLLAFDSDINALDSKQHGIQQHQTALAAMQAELQQLTAQLGNASAPDNLASKSFTEQVQAIDQLRAQINNFNANLHSETVLLQSLDMQVNEKKFALTSVENWLADHAADETLLANFPEIGKLKRVKAELFELETQQKSFGKWTKSTESALKNNSNALNTTSKKLSDFKKQLAQEEDEIAVLMRDKTIEQVDVLRATQQDRNKDFQTLVQLAQAHHRLTSDGFNFFGLSKKAPPADVDALTERLESLRLDLKREENIKRVLDSQVAFQVQLRKMTPERQHLEDDKPCPLCGSLEHPYAKQPPVIGNSQQAMIDQQAKIKAIVIAIQQLTTQVDSAKRQAEKNAATQKQIAALSSHWLMLCNRLNVATAELKIGDVEAMKLLAKMEDDELREIAALASKYRSKRANIEKFKSAITRNEQTVEQLQLSNTKLDSNWQERLQEQEDYQTTLAAHQQEETQLTALITEQLTQLGEKLPSKGQEDLLIDRLNQRRLDYHAHSFRRKNLQEELAAIYAKQAMCQTEIDGYNNLVAQCAVQLHGEETTALHLAIIEKQQLIAAKEQLLLQTERDSVELERALQTKLQSTPCADIAALRETLTLLHSQGELEQRRNEQENDIASKEAELEKLRKRLTVQSEQAKLAPSPEELEQELRSLTEKIAIANLETRRLEKILVEQQQAQQQVDMLNAQLQQQQTAAQPYLDEAAQLATESGVAFRRRVQQRIIDQLLSETNAVLEKISGRYYLRQRNSEQGLALVIEDTFQNNARRSPKTLSGGESFIVSLALALGLSEMASNGKSVDSLFLDEGFGNLDAENLYTVISTLENLHSQHGKTVGVISHVDAVQKRFKAQLQVVKKPNGMGMLTLM